MPTRKLFALMANTDRTEGRGSSYATCYTTTRALGEQVIQSKKWGRLFGPMDQPGSPGDVKEVEVAILEDFDEASDFLNEAMLKLATPWEERTRR